MTLSTGSKVFLGVLLLLVVGVLGGLRWANSQLEPEEGVPTEPVTFVVERGTTRGDLAQQLEGVTAQGLVHRPFRGHVVPGASRVLEPLLGV